MVNTGARMFAVRSTSRTPPLPGDEAVRSPEEDLTRQVPSQFTAEGGGGTDGFLRGD